MTYRCNICQRIFSARSGLTRHANAVHHERTTLFQANEPRYQRSDAMPEHDEVLWNTPITMPITMPTLNNPTPDEDINMEEHSENVQEQEPIESQPHYNLRS